MELEVVFQLFLAVILGALIGLEREYRKKEAGLKTYSLVTLGTSLFTIISFGLFNFFPEKANIDFDPTRIIQAVAVGIGFIGAGVIFHRESGVQGLTTAAGLWVASAIGIAVGAELYSLAIFTTFLALLILAGFTFLENKIFHKE